MVCLRTPRPRGDGVQGGDASPFAQAAGDVKVQARRSKRKGVAGREGERNQTQNSAVLGKNLTTTTTLARVSTCIPRGPPDTCKPELLRNHPCSGEPDKTPRDNGTEPSPAAGHRGTLPRSTHGKGLLRRQKPLTISPTLSHLARALLLETNIASHSTCTLTHLAFLLSDGKTFFRGQG